MGRRILIEADGGSRGNPGPAGYGAVVRDADSQEVLAERAASLGNTTNNVAEYSGLIAGLEAALELSPSDVEARLDSKLVVEQMSGRWRINHENLKPLARKAAALAAQLPQIRYTWIPRAKNAHADRLANEAMDAAARGQQWRRAETAADSAVQASSRQSVGAPESTVDGLFPGWWRSNLATTTPTTMLLVRHGQTIHSPERRFSGREDVTLTSVGCQQAEALAQRIAHYPVAAIVSSPLTRTVQTAEFMSKSLELPVDIVDDLIEMDFGDWQGKTIAQVQENRPTDFEHWRSSPENPVPGGESYAAVVSRVRLARERILEKYPARTIVVVSHVTPIKSMLLDALGTPIDFLSRTQLDVGSLSIVDWYGSNRAVVRSVNDTGHLS